MKRVDKVLEQNQAHVTIASFVESYNRMLAPGFPQASNKALLKFQATYPLLFKNGDSWSIEKHRKRFMDWFSTHYDKV